MTGPSRARRLGAALAVSLVVASLERSTAIKVELENADEFVEIKHIRHADYRNTTCGERCSEYCTPNNCPLNVVTFEWDRDSEYSNASESLYTVMSTVGSPAVVLGYCGYDSECQLSLDDVETPNNFWAEVLNNEEARREAGAGRAFEQVTNLLHFTKDPDEQLTDAEDIFSMALQFEELIEFRDSNGDTAYTADTDEVLQRVHLGSVKWKIAEFGSVASPGTTDPTAQILSWNVTTNDGTVSFRYETSTYPDAPMSNPSFSSLSDPQVRTPNSTRVVLLIQNFTFVGGDDSRLALKTFIISPDDDAAFAELVGRQILLADRSTNRGLGFLSWTPMAVVQAGGGPSSGGATVQRVKASPLRDVLSASELGYSLATSVKGTSSEERVLYFAFAGASFAPRLIMWDLSIGHGEFPVRTKEGFWAGAIVLTLVIAGMALIVVNRNMIMEAAHRAARPSKPKAGIHRFSGPQATDEEGQHLVGGGDASDQL
eukprot:CAMPEP_0196782738 /NCGR_PEP_ID=MMETSP1104-20130614/11975_1 /TAXON_ID=33652 /ORGANISM="Cafeteria sp., Strain Caron Lab Isolate" /LENGTH=486 /DNA_ID=CAMNT_0042152981 /DNA_START=10 /DNA_END=1470 /DNA_ORIENTATION=+